MQLPLNTTNSTNTANSTLGVHLILIKQQQHDLLKQQQHAGQGGHCYIIV